MYGKKLEKDREKIYIKNNKKIHLLESTMTATFVLEQVLTLGELGSGAAVSTGRSWLHKQGS